MHKLLFQNRFNALVFVAIILFSVRILVGTPDDSGALESATAKFGSAEQGPKADHETVRPAPQPMATEFTPEEDLIDEASGEDAAGWSTEPAAEEASIPNTVEFIDESGEADEG